MLIRFGCANYKSIYGYQELLFTASSLKDPQADVLKNVGIPESVLPSIGIYGANASGKTNMIKALAFLVGFINDSYAQAKPNGIKRPIFKLNSNAKVEVSEFDIDFIFADKHYHYGFKINDEAVTEEWLFAYAYDKRKSRKVLFHRSIAEENVYKFSSHLKGENRLIAKLTRANSLYLSTAAQNNHELLGAIYSCFNLSFFFRINYNYHQQLLQSLFMVPILKECGTLKQVADFIRNAGAGIDAVELKARECDGVELKMLNGLQNVVNDSLGDHAVNMEAFIKDGDTMELAHKDQHGNIVLFDLEEESLGTKAMVALLPVAFKVLNQGGVFIVDEIESSLHVFLTIQIIKLFNRKETNPKGAQLLFTTHETHILCSNILRRDQIWFSEKAPDGATVIAPLTDYQLRGTDNIQKGYLEGRFGAIPFLGDMQQLFQSESPANG
ncbi:AAA family ATPase [Methylovulum psychrotolerans]|uniref:AAA family ATPase n=1 Tax=Methylovulum psychrotolerans TaxID=1704499 RepID=UPI00255CC3C1|nr:ATP-binding protein [Methylovulum psychrotolerans]